MIKVGNKTTPGYPRIAAYAYILLSHNKRTIIYSVHLRQCLFFVKSCINSRISPDSSVSPDRDSSTSTLKENCCGTHYNAGSYAVSARIQKQIAREYSFITLIDTAPTTHSTNPFSCSIEKYLFIFAAIYP